MTLCSFGDGREAVALGLCGTHWKRQWRGTEADGPIRTVTPEDTLACIKQLQKDTGLSPTMRELAMCLGLASPSTVHVRLHKLEQDGLITMQQGKPRSIVLVEGKK